ARLPEDRRLRQAAREHAAIAGADALHRGRRRVPATTARGL
ncbi:MAG: hypothetical protein AVDCRST_MAG40-1503, partial [uncultured Gemmatimonadaceae bacterium]